MVACKIVSDIYSGCYLQILCQYQEMGRYLPGSCGERESFQEARAAGAKTWRPRIIGCHGETEAVHCGREVGSEGMGLVSGTRL